MLSLNELIKPENAKELKRIGELDNLEELEKIFGENEEIRNYIFEIVSERIGRCGKITYIAMKTAGPRKMTVREIADLIYAVFNKKWSEKSIKTFLNRLESVKMVESKKKFLKTYYKINI